MRPFSTQRITAITAVILFLPTLLAAEDWLRFRGPNGAGISTESAEVPTKWSPSENLKWKVALPGSGVSSPIVVGDRVLVTCYSGYGLSREEPGELEDLKRHLVCVDRSSGKILWDKSVDAVLPEDPYSGIGVTNHGYASHTPVSDGKNVYAFFGKSGVVAFDLEGNQLWTTSVGKESDPWAWGSASSPIIYGDHVIVTAAAESQSIVGLNKETGEEAWRQAAGSLDGTWGTPIVASDGERDDLVLSVAGEIWGMNPANGKLRWYCSTSGSEQAHSSAVFGDGVVYAVSGRGGASAAVKVGGKGDVTESHLVWKGSETARFGSPVLHEGNLYLIANGIFRVLEASSGKTSFQARLPGAPAGDAGGRSGRGRGEGGRGEGGRGGGGRRGGRGGGGGFGSLDYASPVIAAGHLFYVNGKGDTTVYKLGDEPEQIAVNKVTEESETFGGTPAISNNQIFLRSNSHLYCVGK